MAVISAPEWDHFLEKYPNAHILQTRLWGEFKANFGWKPVYIQSGTSGSQVLFRKIPFGFSLGYIPKGPIGLNRKELLDEIVNQCNIENAIGLYLEPDCWEEEYDPKFLLNLQFDKSKVSIQPRRTILVSLEGSEENLLERMKQKTRYNIRLAQKKGVTVEPSNDIEIFIQLMKQTSLRDQFSVHDPNYYRLVFKEFSVNNKCELLIAKFSKKPVAALMIFFHGNRAWYFYGASSDEERNRMPAYLLQWEAMKHAAKRGCTEYDLWGVPDDDEAFLEENFMVRNDGLWGVYRFKRGFGGKLARSAGVFQKEIKPFLFKPYQLAINLRKGSIS
jgi:peptidoglycan pentaglycine glycine transferase (the first glycine)